MSTFPQFSVLPKELQLLVWYFALPDPRTVHITNIDTQTRARTELYEPVKSRHQMPGLLTACRTSRGVFERHYKKICETSASFTYDQPTYFDLRRDTLYLDVTWHIYHGPIVKNFSELGTTEVLDSIRYIAVDYTPWSMLCTFHAAEMVVPLLRLFPSLEKLSFVFGAPCVCCQGNSFKFPVDLLEVRRGSRHWPFKRRIRWKVLLAAERIRQRHPEMKLPKFEVKRIQKR
jgi:hypothetical protein